MTDERDELAQSWVAGIEAGRMSEYRQRLADMLEKAWMTGEISHAEACAELAEFDRAGTTNEKQ